MSSSLRMGTVVTVVCPQYCVILDIKSKLTVSSVNKYANKCPTVKLLATFIENLLHVEHCAGENYENTVGLDSDKFQTGVEWAALVHEDYLDVYSQIPSDDSPKWIE